MKSRDYTCWNKPMVGKTACGTTWLESSDRPVTVRRILGQVLRHRAQIVRQFVFTSLHAWTRPLCSDKIAQVSTACAVNLGIQRAPAKDMCYWCAKLRSSSAWISLTVQVRTSVHLMQSSFMISIISNSCKLLMSNKRILCTHLFLHAPTLRKSQSSRSFAFPAAPMTKKLRNLHEYKPNLTLISKVHSRVPIK